MSKLYDGSCLTLAREFLMDAMPPPNADLESDAETLASAIQDLVESFMRDYNYQ